MKKVLFLFLMAVCMTGCKDDNEAKKLVAAEVRIKGIEKRLSLTQQQLVSGTGCGKQFVLISRSKFANDAEFTTWKTKYDEYLFTGTKTGLNTCPSGETYYFNIIQYISKNNDFSKEKFAAWLNQNGKYICIDQMYEMIECLHKIDNQQVISILEMLLPSVKPTHILSVQDVKDMIAKKKGSLTLPNDTHYNNDAYGDYMNFEINANDEITFNLTSTSKPTGDYYSIPFIRSVYQVNHDKYNIKETDDILYFIKVPYFSSVSQIFLAVKVSPTTYVYYDFSQIPPTSPGGLGSYYDFTPL